MLEPSTPHIGKGLALVAWATALVHINARPSQIAEMITHFTHHFLDSYEPGLSYRLDSYEPCLSYRLKGYESGLAARTSKSLYLLLIHFVFVHVSQLVGQQR